MAANLNKELLYLIMQFLEEEKFMDALHKLEQESGIFFNVKYLEELVLAGEWDELEKYLSGFIKVGDNRFSMKIFFEIRKQKYLEALDRQERGKALEILRDDLRDFATFNDELYKELTQLLTLDNIRHHEQLSKYDDTKEARSIMLIELKKMIDANAMFRDKLVFPTLKASRLQTLVNQSLNWQHQLCKHPKLNPDIKTLFTDHSCGVQAPTPVTLPVAAIARPAAYLPVGVHAPFASRPTAPSANALAGWLANATASSSVQSAAASTSLIPGQPNQVSVLKRPRTPPNSLAMVEIDDQSSECEGLSKRARSAAQQTDEVTHPAALQQASSLIDQLPKTVVCTLLQGSDVTSIDFHPSHQTSVIVGSDNGEITLWNIGLREKLISKLFKIWDIASSSLPFQAVIGKDSSISTSRVRWSLDGNFIGVAFTKHLIQLYATGGTNLRQCVEIDAHVGRVNDLAFSCPNKQLCLVTCGDDKQIKVWDLKGQKLFTFEGHEAPVYSVCPHQRENIQFMFSAAIDGKIKAWLYDNFGSRVDYDAPGHGRTTMIYSADGTRLFSCSTNKDGESFLVEWDESEGEIQRTYTGLGTKSAGVVQFDTTQNHFLAVGEDHHIKFWDMDNANILTATDADGGLPSIPCLRLNKEGNILVVSTSEKGFKILASTEGLRSLRAFESLTFEGSRLSIEPSGTKGFGSAPFLAASNGPIVPRVERLERRSPPRPSPFLNGDDHTTRSVEKERALEDVPDNAKACELAEVIDPVKCQVVTTPESADPLSKVVRLLYKNSGGGILALGSNGKLKLWKWPCSEQNPSGKVMTQFLPAPSAATFLAFNPRDNNVIAVGTKDSSIHIYNIRVDEFCLWNTDTWEMRKSVTIPLPDGKESIGETQVQFNCDQTRLLVANETRIAIYDASKMEFVQQRVPHDALPANISSVAYSYKRQLVYASFVDGNIGVFDADTLKLKCRIAPSVYLSQAVASGQDVVHPLVIETHPKDVRQFAVGMTDGSVKVLEPSKSDQEWGMKPPVENGVSRMSPGAESDKITGAEVAESSSTSDRPAPEQPQS